MTKKWKIKGGEGNEEEEGMKVGVTNRQSVKNK